MQKYKKGLGGFCPAERDIRSLAALVAGLQRLVYRKETRANVHRTPQNVHLELKTGVKEGFCL
jgi:hypothetical protein